MKLPPVAPTRARYLREFLPRLSASHLQRDEDCVHGLWAPWATLAPPSSLRPTTSPKRIDAATAKLFDRIDADRDGRVSVGELVAWMRVAPAASWAREMWSTDDSWHGSVLDEAARQEMAGELMETHIVNAVLWQDTNEDGAISLEELRRSTRRWHASLIRLREQRRRSRKWVSE